MNEHKTLRIAIVGEPNAGKSTLTNALVGQKVAIVTPKVQTTRHNVTGVLTEGDTQLIFVDTPGLFIPEKTLEKKIVRNAWNGVADAEQICILIDAKKGITPYLRTLLSQIQQRHHANLICVINKIDLVAKPILLHLAKELAELGLEDIFMVSALKDRGLRKLVSKLISRANVGEWLYDEEHYTDQNIRALAEEITREQAFLLLNKEIPYSLKVETEKWEDLRNGDVKIYQAIIILKDSQKSIVVGSNGSKIKDIGRRARDILQKILGHKVHLFLHVKIKEDWITNG